MPWVYVLRCFIEHKMLDRAVQDYIRRAGLQDFDFVRTADTADVCLDADATGMRLGGVIDWLIARRDDPQGQLPNEIQLATGALNLGAALFIPLKGESVRLTGKERDLLAALYRAPRRRMIKNDLLAQVWGYAPGLETHTLETHVYRLRQKLELDPAKPAAVLTDADAYRLETLEDDNA